MIKTIKTLRIGPSTLESIINEEAGRGKKIISVIRVSEFHKMESLDDAYTAHYLIIYSGLY